MTLAAPVLATLGNARQIFSGWKTTLQTSVFLSPASVNGASHGTTLTAFADVNADVDVC
jgi:hypothetical protein